MNDEAFAGLETEAAEIRQVTRPALFGTRRFVLAGRCVRRNLVYRHRYRSVFILPDLERLVHEVRQRRELRESLLEEFLLRIEVKLPHGSQADQTGMDFRRSMEPARIFAPGSAEIDCVESYQCHVLLQDVLHELPILQAQSAAVAKTRGFHMAGIDGELNELGRQALVDQ